MNFQAFLQILGTLVSEHFPEEVDASIKPTDSANCLPCRELLYDFIIIGAGSAGSVLANRLSENPNWKILLIEAGGDEDYISDVPRLWPTLAGTKFDWNYTTVPQIHNCKFTEGRCSYTRGHAMGGSSTVNAMFYDRGSPEDFDRWEMMGNPGWGYDKILKYFLKSENITIAELAKSPFHSTAGPLSVSYSIYKTPFFKELKKAGIDLGWHLVDYNSKNRVGISNLQRTTRGPSRCSTSKAFLNVIKNRKNLFIFKNTLAKKLIINEKTKTAEGVTCITDGVEYNVYATKEVILSAGSINTPKLLMLSGIGPANHLAQLGIPVLANVPAVGNNLMDHDFIELKFNFDSPMGLQTKELYTFETAFEYAKYKRGPLTLEGIDIVAQLNRRSNFKLANDICILFSMDSYKAGNASDNNPYLSVFLGIVGINSIGTVRLANGDYRTPPLIDPRYYSNPSDIDLAIWAIWQVFAYVNSPVLAKYSLKWDYNLAWPCKDFVIGSNDHLICYISYMSQTFFHPVGTARMGPKGKNSVVDSTLKVHAIDNLRIVDASIMPRITHSATNAATIMIAEHAADIIKNYFRN